MNGAHFHLLLNHAPIFGLLGSLLLLLWGFFRRDEKAVRFGLAISVIAGLVTLPVFLSGEPAEDVIQNLPHFSEHLVEAHEEAAEVTVWMVGFAALVSGAGLFFSLKKGALPRLGLAGIMAAVILSAIAIGRVNNLGGQVSHPEIRKEN